MYLFESHARKWNHFIKSFFRVMHRKWLESIEITSFASVEYLLNVILPPPVPLFPGTWSTDPILQYPAIYCFITEISLNIAINYNKMTGLSKEYDCCHSLKKALQLCLPPNIWRYERNVNTVGSKPDSVSHFCICLYMVRQRRSVRRWLQSRSSDIFWWHKYNQSIAF